MKANPPRRLPLTTSTQRSVEKIITLLDQAERLTGYSHFEVFNRALNVFDAALHGVRLNTWMNEVCVGLERALVPLSLAMNELLAQATLNYEDILGLVYMRLQYGDARKGQFFTPYTVARAMAEMSSLHHFSPPGPGEGPLVIGDPCCGSGILLLAAMEVIERQHPEALDDGSVLFFGADIDPTCVTMARVNIDIHRLGAYIRREICTHNPAEAQRDSPPEVPALELSPSGSALKGRPSNVRVRQTSELNAQERAAVERALGGPLPGQEALPLFDAQDQPPARSSEEGQPPVPTRSRSQVARRRSGLDARLTQGRLFVTNEPLLAAEEKGERYSEGESVQ